MKTKIKNCLGGKAFTSVIIGFVILTLVFMIAQCIPYFEMDFTNKKMSSMLEGKYSVDGGEWKVTEPTRNIDDHFYKITIKGKLNETAANFAVLAFTSKDIWYTISSADGKFEISNRRSKPDIPEELFAPSERMTGTPGFGVMDILTESFPESVLNGKQDMIIEAEYPYSMATQSFSDCFGVMYCQQDGLYNQLFFKSMPSFLLFVLVCFFGLFFFPVSSFVLGKVNYKYLCFGALCLFWGLYMITQSLGDFLNLWITDVTICLFAVRMMSYLFISTIFLYFKSYLTKPVTRAIANCTIAAFFLAAATAGVLHLTNTLDLTATRPNIFVNIAVCSVVMIILLCAEIRGNRNTLLFLISWSPLMLTLMIDILDQYIHIPESHFFNYGLAITMAYQIISLILDLHKQYKEAIRYQQIQKELYEAKVNVMVSQIQPHFMYNALTSIAVMCELEPKTAKEATITFAKYLRGNMDSLKQTAPVPFAQELEHLKKYLYIEKLRFDDLLNIEYDIQTTDFRLPMLSIQPLVENAVKHGVGMKEDGGTVKISTRETDTAYEVIIRDDGVGFDTNIHKNDERSHIGMQNTKKRLRDMCGGEVKIESVVGEGTTVTIILPKEEQPNENTVY
jgi:signal transduction histidine kinase